VLLLLEVVWNEHDCFWFWLATGLEEGGYDDIVILEEGKRVSNLAMSGQLV